MFTYILEVKKELLVCVSLSVLYLTYYLVEVVKKPILICRKGEFRQLLEENVPILNEYYWPTPWCVESRLQTVIGSVLRSLLLPPLQFRREVLKLSDGGQVALDWLEEGEAECRAVLLVLPGLTGGAQADYVRSLAAAARHLRAALVVFNNRGLGGLPLTTPRLYSAVSHEDVGEAVAAVGARGVPVLAVGVSLGGLLLGRYLAERGERAQLHAALIVSSPLDVVKGSQCMEQWGLNAALSWHMARQLRGTVRASLPALATRVRDCRSVRAFDAAFTAPHFGFPSPDEYYRAASLRPRLARVARPLLCLCAADDPFQPIDVLPLREAASSARVALCVTARGGHIGFLEGWWPARAAHRQYVARLAEQYFAALLPARLDADEPKQMPALETLHTPPTDTPSLFPLEGNSCTSTLTSVSDILAPIDRSDAEASEHPSTAALTHSSNATLQSASPTYSTPPQNREHAPDSPMPPSVEQNHADSPAMS